MSAPQQCFSVLVRVFFVTHMPQRVTIAVDAVMPWWPPACAVQLNDSCWPFLAETSSALRVPYVGPGASLGQDAAAITKGTASSTLILRVPGIDSSLNPQPLPTSTAVKLVSNAQYLARLP